MLSLVAAVLLAASLVQAANTGFVDNFGGNTLNARYTLPTYSAAMATGTTVANGFVNMPLSGTWGTGAGANLSIPIPTGNFVATALVRFNPLAYGTPNYPGTVHTDLTNAGNPTDTTPPYDPDPLCRPGYIAGAGMAIMSADNSTQIGLENVKEMGISSPSWGADPFMSNNANPLYHSLSGLAMYPQVQGGFADPLWTSTGAGSNAAGFGLLRNAQGYGLYSTGGDTTGLGQTLNTNTATPDMWMRIARINNVYSFFVSGDGTNFTLIKTVTPDANWAPITKLGLCDSGPGLTGTASFSNFVVRELAGDSNIDGKVDFTDYQALAGNWQQSGKTLVDGDFNGDGVVDFTDYQILAGAWQQTDPYIGTYGSLGYTPEPVTMALLALGGLGLLRRRK
jgi:hypothetical protein